VLAVPKSIAMSLEIMPNKEGNISSLAARQRE
jgi:hypothetical protein